MTYARKPISLLGALVFGLACGAALDAAGFGWVHSATLLVAIAAAAGGLQGAAWPRLSKRPPRVASAAIVAGVAAFILYRAPFGWLDLGPIGAGPPGELPLVVLPVTCVLAAMAALRPRGASSRC